jgi:hypothetical protein
MWGGSYGGYAQWATAKELPPHLSAIVPVASPYVSVDFPLRDNISVPYVMLWLTLVSGRTSQERIFWHSSEYWCHKFREYIEQGIPFKDLDRLVGNPSEIFQEWLAHPHRDAYWDQYNPTPGQYARIDLPILTITGFFDGDQPGALAHYRQHMRHASSAQQARHFLVIGPWDHGGTRVPQPELYGIKLGPASLVDMPQLHLQWYAWTLRGGPKPDFLKNNVAYYVMGAEEWRYAASLEEVTARMMPLHLGSTINPTDVFRSGFLGPAPATASGPDHYVYDPRDTSHAALDVSIDPESLVDQRMIHASVSKQLIYHSAPFDEAVEITGCFSLSLWLAIDQPDTDFRACVYEIDARGASMLLSTDSVRARYRESLREERLIDTTQPLRYDFQRFTFISKRIGPGSRLRLVIGPIASIYSQKNYNSGGVVSEESLRDARAVNVQLFHDERHPSVLYVPLGHPV